MRTRRSNRSTPVFQAAPRRTLGSLMDLYESNFALLMRLAPDSRVKGRRQISRIRSHVDLHLEELERGPYTSCIALTHYFDNGVEAQPEPDFRIRIAYDAGAAEVVSFRIPRADTMQLHTAPLLFTRGFSTLDWKWQANNFLQKWLRYCLDRGHRFPPDPRVSLQISSRSPEGGRLTDPVAPK